MNSLEKRQLERERGLATPRQTVRQRQDEYLKKLLEQSKEMEKPRPFNYAGVPASPINRCNRR